MRGGAGHRRHQLNDSPVTLVYGNIRERYTS
jgi:hypothetical protein